MIVKAWLLEPRGFPFAFISVAVTHAKLLLHFKIPMATYYLTPSVVPLMVPMLCVLFVVPFSMPLQLGTLSMINEQWIPANGFRPLLIEFFEQKDDYWKCYEPADECLQDYAE